MEHFYNNIQGWFNYQGLYSKIVNEAISPARFVEVGSWKGQSASYMAVEIINSSKNIEFYCVDTWLGTPNEIEHQNDQDVQEGTLYEKFIENMSTVEGHYIPLRMDSLEAVNTFEDESLDFVYIDASHDYESVKKDIENWYPKVKKGGILAGHDYTWDTVNRAVHDVLGNQVESFDTWNWLVKK